LDDSLILLRAYDRWGCRKRLAMRFFQMVQGIERTSFEFIPGKVEIGIDANVFPELVS
jgi:hypothetical protein